MNRLGISGRIANHFLISEITPLLAILGLLMGLFAILVTPREEEPQIDVTFANVFIPFPGASATEVEQLVAIPAEQILSEISGVKHIYSTSSPGMALITVRFKVGEKRESAIIRLQNKVFSNSDWLPANLGVGQPIIKPKGIDDVPIVSATLWSEDPAVGSYELGHIAHAIEAELKQVPGTRDIYTIGDAQRVLKLTLNPQSLAGYGIDLNDLRQALQSANHIRDNLTHTVNNHEVLLQAGTFLSSAEEVANLIVGLFNGKPVYLRDVAKISEGSDQAKGYVWLATGPQAAGKNISASGSFPAVTIAIAKKPGSNAVEIAKQVIERFEQLKGIYIPDGINVTITRNYGETADAKAKKLITKLLFATASVVLLVLIAVGWKEAIIVGAAVIVTLAMTLFASWAWGFTINRVSLFALIFSIGILVDDAIVVVENIHRHVQMGADNLLEAIPKAVDEVGGPTILATFTVIAALLPMAFVSGLMGPYMSPIPINASMGMLISLLVAFIFTPWMTYKALANQKHATPSGEREITNGWLFNLFNHIISPFLVGGAGRLRRWILLLVVLLMIGGAVNTVVNRSVIMKMLPFDNKSEFQVILDMPEGTSLEQTSRVLDEIGSHLATVDEVSDYQVYAGTAAPISFNGLVRQYNLRQSANLGDIQVNLVDKSQRERKSHEIALAVRQPIKVIADQFGADVRIVEVPPGPPVMAPLVAEIYGLDYSGQVEHATSLRKLFETTADIIDINDSTVFPAQKWLLEVNRSKAAELGLPQQQISQALATLLDGEDVTYLHRQNQKYALPVRLTFSDADHSRIDQLLTLHLRSRSGAMVPLSEVVNIVDSRREQVIHHKDLKPVVYVSGDMAGETDSPLYGMFAISAQLEQQQGIEQWFLSQPKNPYAYAMKWDGEWQITYETFRDMGIAYSVGLIMIYLLVVAQFGSYTVPLVIMAPIPLTIIGILPGHALLGAQFTATSMIGMIALAGIIVRNSILLVDFINQQIAQGMPLEKAVVQSAVVRAKPIILTALAAMAGAFFILDDPIFSGLAVSLISGLLVSTLMTLVLIPVIYYASKS
jgi:multidrug efflux pump subunit AcrB